MLRALECRLATPFVRTTDHDATQCAAAESLGGAVFAEDTHFAMANALFDGNTASDGAALHYRGIIPAALSTAQTSRFVGNTPDPTVRAFAQIDWTCSPGQYMPQIGVARGDFDRCLSKPRSRDVADHASLQMLAA